jgi:MFS family permease
MLKKIGLNIAWVIVLGVISQIVNILFFSIWGRLSDRYSNKSVLSVSGTLFIVSILMWTFTTMPGPYLLTIPLLILIHALAGMSTAGVALCSSNIALKFAPRGKATSYLAVNSLVSGIAATVAPVIAGASVDMLKSKQLKLTFTWISEKKSFHLPAMDLTGLDFLFLAAFVLGLYSLHRLLAVKEEGEAKDKVVIQELLTEMRQGVRNISTAAGMKYLFAVPIMGTGRKIDSGRAGK